jgi:hypothetical protein
MYLIFQGSGVRVHEADVADSSLLSNRALSVVFLSTHAVLQIQQLFYAYR